MKAARESVVRAEELLAADKAQDAIAELGPALVLLLGEESIRARVVLARAYMTLPKLRGRAEAILTEAIRDSPKDPALHLLLGRVHVLRGNRDPAMAASARRWSSRPATPRPRPSSTLSRRLKTRQRRAAPSAVGAERSGPDGGVAVG